MVDYAELAAYSNFSFLKGASHPAELVQTAAALGYRALALTDEASLAGIVRAHVAANALLPAELAQSELAQSNMAQANVAQANVARFTLLVGATFRVGSVDVRLIAQNRLGYGQLCALISQARAQAPKGAYRLSLTDICQAPLSDCLVIINHLTPADHWLQAPAAARGVTTAVVRDITDSDWGAWHEQFATRLSLGVRRLRQGYDAAELSRAAQIARRFGIAKVALGDVWLHTHARQPLADVLTAIRLGTTLAQAGKALHVNAERRLRTRAELVRLFTPAELRRSVECAERCDFTLSSLRYEYPDDLVPAGATPQTWLRERVMAGLARRYPHGVPLGVRELIERELQLIAELQYEAYFLTVDDLVTFARTLQILCQGRGSAANSAVCYALGITEVDPARQAVLFERFLSKERAEPPDIDVDFEHARREEVIQYLYQRYGRERAALAATVICYRPRSALRDVGRVLGVSASELNRVSQALTAWRGERVAAEQWREWGIAQVPPCWQTLLQLAGELLGFPRHLSQHVGGFVIARRRLSEWVPIENAAMPARTVIQWDKDDLDTLGLLKVDVLGLGMLTAIRTALDLVSQVKALAQPLTLADIPAEDPATYAMLQRADTVGVFQVESRAQMAMLPRLKPQCFYDLVIEVALVRPGPLQGGMVHPYLRRRQGVEAIDYPSQAVQSVLARTLGVPIFQEQVMQLAMVAAGFSGGEADQLRRAMAAWKKSGSLAAWRTRWFEGLRARGYSEAFAEASFRQILGFGEYGFPESHAASFALLVYSSAWLKCHHPAAFTAALLNCQPMGFYAPAQLIADAKQHGVRVLPVDVQWSGLGASLEGADPALRLGLRQIHGANTAMLARIVAARALIPTRRFTDVADLAERAQLTQAELLQLSTAGALTSLHGSRHHVAWRVLGLAPTSALWPVRELGAEGVPLLPTASEGQEVVQDYRRLGLSLRRHPVAILRARWQEQRLCTHAWLAREARDGIRVGIIGLVLVRQRPPTAKGVMFITLEDDTGSANVVVWPERVLRWQTPLRVALLLEVWGQVQRVDNVVHVVLERAIDRTEWLQTQLLQA